MFVIKDGIHNMLVRIANREDPDQTASDLGLHCLSRPFLQAPTEFNLEGAIDPLFTRMAPC